MAQRASWDGSASGPSTVCLCESESKRASPATSVRTERLVCNTHTANWSVYTDRADQLARERKLEDAEEYLSLALSEAIKGFGTDDPHTAEARQNLADHYRVMQKYDLAVPLYIEMVESLTSIYGPQDARTATARQNVADRYKEMQKYDLAIPLYIEVVDSLTSMYGPQDAKTVTALHNLAGLYTAQKDILAASKTMLRAIEAGPLNYSDNKRLKVKPVAVWQAVAKSARGLAAIYREAGHSLKEVVELLEKDLRFLTKEGEGLGPGNMVMIYAMPAFSIFEEQEESIKTLSDAEAICRAFISNLKNNKDRKDSLYELSGLFKTLACNLRAQGRLDEARQLCVEANNHYLTVSGKQVAKSNWNDNLPALELLIEIELEDGSQDSLLRALNYRQDYCKRGQADLDETIYTIESGGVGWDKMEEKYRLERIEIYKERATLQILSLTKGQQRLAEVQSRLDKNLDAWTTLTQALALLQSPQAIELQKVEHPFATNRFREDAGGRKQEIQHQISALHETICSPLVDSNAEQCVNLQQQLMAALAA